MDIGNITSTYENIYASASNQTASKLEKELGKDYSQTTDDELMDACKQFEAYFLEQVFKEMLKTIPSNEETSGSTSTMMDYCEDLFVQNIAEQSTEQNSLGLAQMLYEQMRRNYGLDTVNPADSTDSANGSDGAGNQGSESSPAV